MKAYELLYFVNPVLDEEDQLATLKRIDTTIVSQGGTVDNVEEWGRRKLAFEVDKLVDGEYTLIDFHANPANIAEIDRVLRITDAVKRFMIINRADRDQENAG
ncbi:MAG: 30S ribosomal protein S6 [Coriobacteriales bacterium]|jgi:small subunit ribosomal protein S6|nr:30S ribosomal protein S6 [Coriobacteriales bacterium]